VKEERRGDEKGEEVDDRYSIYIYICMYVKGAYPHILEHGYANAVQCMCI